MIFRLIVLTLYFVPSVLYKLYALKTECCPDSTLLTLNIILTLQIVPSQCSLHSMLLTLILRLKASATHSILSRTNNKQYCTDSMLLRCNVAYIIFPRLHVAQTKWSSDTMLLRLNVVQTPCYFDSMLHRHNLAPTLWDCYICRFNVAQTQGCPDSMLLGLNVA